MSILTGRLKQKKTPSTILTGSVTGETAYYPWSILTGRPKNNKAPSTILTGSATEKIISASRSILTRRPEGRKTNTKGSILTGRLNKSKNNNETKLTPGSILTGRPERSKTQTTRQTKQEWTKTKFTRKHKRQQKAQRQHKTLTTTICIPAQETKQIEFMVQQANKSECRYTIHHLLWLGGSAATKRQDK